MVDYTEFAYNIAMSWIGNPNVLKHSEKNAVFQCIVNNGSFSHHDETKNIIIKADEGFHWSDGETDKDEFLEEKGGEFYV